MLELYQCFWVSLIFQIQHIVRGGKQMPETVATIIRSHSITSPAEQAAAGKALRDKLPRKILDSWKGSKGRRDPIALLRKSDADRMKELMPIRYGRMLQSPFAFYRGSAVVMAFDLAQTPITGIKVQACGDCHLMNFGRFCHA